MHEHQEIDVVMATKRELTSNTVEQAAQSAERHLEELMARSQDLPPEHQAAIEASVGTLSTVLERVREREEELVAAHDDLDRSERRYRDLFDFTPDGLLVTDARGVIQEANRAAAEILKPRQNALLGRPLVDFVAEPRRDAFQNRLRALRLAEDRHTVVWETRLRSGEGNGFPAAVTARPVPREQRGLNDIRWRVRDISENRRLVNEKRRQRLFLEQLMDVTPVGIAVVRGDDHRIEMANAFFRSMPAIKRPVVGRTLEEILGARAARRMIKLLDRIYRTARPIRLREHQALWGDVEDAYWNVDLVPLQDLTGAVDGVLILPRDASQEVHARQEIERLAENLQQERDKLRTIMENTHAQLAYLDADFNFVHVNTAYAEDAGHTRDELIGRNHFDLFPNAENQAIFERVVETGKAISYRGKPFVYPDQPSRGMTYWDWSLVPVQGEKGEVEGLVFSLLNVTERERLMIQLDAEQARLNAIIRNTPEGIVVVDERARITLTNPAADEMYGRRVPHGEPYSKHLGLCLCYPDGTAYRPRDLPLTRAALDGETHEDLELALTRPDGERRDLLVSTAPIRNNRGEITGAVGVFRDISERKRIEEAVRQYAERLRVLHELDQAILVARSAEEIAAASLTRLRHMVPCRRSSVELFDFAAEEATVLAVDVDGETSLRTGRQLPMTWNRSLDELEQGKAHVVADLSRVPPSPSIEALRQEGIRSFISLPLRARGELMGALNLGMETVGAPSGTQMAAIEDVAQQLAIGIRQARLHEALQAYADELEQRVAARTAQLEASEARFRAVFEQSALGIALLDKIGKLMVGNQALQEMLGRSIGELTGRRFSDFAPPDEDLKASDRMIAGERDHLRSEIRYLTPEDEMRWANIVLSLVRDGNGDPQFIIAMVEDITERKRAHQALIQSEKLATTGRLAASLAHEINNPLQTVIGCLGLAEEAMDGDDDEVGTYVTMAHDELKRAARIVSRLRDLSQPSNVERGEPTDVNTLIGDVLEVSGKDLKDQGIRVVRHLETNLPRPVLMPDRTKQVLLNLVLNARDAMPEGGELTVRTAYDEGRDEVIITVADQGAGIPRQVMDRLFNPFFSTKDDGTGLGLFVSQNIVQEHGGRIEVESSVGDGAVFKVFLPVGGA